MSGEEENAFAASGGAFVVCEPVVRDDFGDVFAGVGGEETDFGELTAQGDEFSTGDATTLGIGHFGKGQREIPHANRSKASVDVVDQQPNADSDGSRHWAWEQAQEFDPGPDERVFETFPHCAGV
jgi:hypothetical protein